MYLLLGRCRVEKLDQTGIDEASISMSWVEGWIERKEGGEPKSTNAKGPDMSLRETTVS